MLSTRDVFIVSPSDKIDKLLNFQKAKDDEIVAVVVEDGKYRGIITHFTLKFARCVSGEKIEKLIWKAPLLSTKMQLEKICEYFLHGYCALPIKDDGKIKIVKNIDVIRALLDDGKIPKLDISKIAKSAQKFSHTTSIARVAALMRKENSQSAIIIENEKFAGIVNSADILPLLKTCRERLPFGKERVDIGKIQIKSVMRKLEGAECSSSIEAANKMIERNCCSLLVSDKIITAQDIIALALPKRETYVDIIGFLDEISCEEIRKECMSFAAKIEKFLHIDRIVVSVKRYETEGKRTKWSLRLRIPRIASVRAFGWNLYTTLHDALSKLERIVLFEKEKMEKWQRTKKKRALAAKLRAGEEIGKPI